MINLAGLETLSEPSATKGYEGRWHTINYFPDWTSAQSFVIGIVLQNAAGEVAYRIVKDFHRLKCFYNNRINQDDVEWAVSELSARIERLKQERAPIVAWKIGSENFSFGEPKYASGRTADSVLTELFDINVALATKKNQVDPEDKYTTPAVRQLVADILRQQIGVEYEKIATDGGIQVTWKDRTVVYDIGYNYGTQVASVYSGWTRTLSTLKHTFWRASAEMTNYVHSRKESGRHGLFLMFPDKRGVMNEKEWDSLHNFMLDESLKLENAGIEVIRHATPEAIAKDLWEAWFQPVLKT